MCRSLSAGATPQSARSCPPGRSRGNWGFAATDLCTRALYDLYTHPAIAEVLRVIVGPEVTLHGISVIRVKLPEDSTLVHPVASGQPLLQRAPDAGKFEANTEHMRVVTAWVPLVDADLGNGCLWVIPGSHRWGFLVRRPRLSRPRC